MISVETSMVDRDEGVVIANGSLSARIISFGATLADLRIVGHPFPLVLGYESTAAYRSHGQYFGAVIGRYANRIAGGRCTVGQEHLTLDRNDGPHHLHGGPKGFATRNWKVDSVGPRVVRLSLVEADGTSGYRGTLRASATYTLAEEGTLRLDLEASSDSTTPINMCHHPYFNFGGGGPIDEHMLAIHAEHYLPAQADLVPTGEIASVSGTNYDFRAPRTIQRPQARETPFNNTYCRPDPGPEYWHAATLCHRGLSMTLHTDQPGVHFYDGYKIADSHPGLQGRRYGVRHGICLEAQGWPDSPNNTRFPTALLRPGEIYRRRTEYRFRLKR